MAGQKRKRGAWIPPNEDEHQGGASDGDEEAGQQEVDDQNEDEFAEGKVDEAEEVDEGGEGDEGEYYEGEDGEGAAGALAGEESEEGEGEYDEGEEGGECDEGEEEGEEEDEDEAHTSDLEYEWLLEKHHWNVVHRPNPSYVKHWPPKAAISYLVLVTGHMDALEDEPSTCRYSSRLEGLEHSFTEDFVGYQGLDSDDPPYVAASWVPEEELEATIMDEMTELTAACGCLVFQGDSDALPDIFAALEDDDVKFCEGVNFEKMTSAEVVRCKGLGNILVMEFDTDSYG